MQKQASKHTNRALWVSVLLSALGLSGCDGGAVGTRIDPLVESEAELSAAVEMEVAPAESARDRMAQRMALVDEIIRARAVRDGSLPPADATSREWAAFYERYAPLRRSLVDEMVAPDELQRLADENREAAHFREPSPDDQRVAREVREMMRGTIEGAR